MKIDYDDVEKIVALVSSGEEIPCDKCGAKIELKIAISNETIGAECSNCEEVWILVTGTYPIDYGD